MMNNEQIRTLEALRAQINALHNARSAWGRGVYDYACDLLDELTETLCYAPESLDNENLLKRALLNGAPDWSQYSWGGGSFCYDADIAERLCRPSELKKTRNGERRPNAREEWLDVQARALYQAEQLILRAYRKVGAR